MRKVSLLRLLSLILCSVLMFLAVSCSAGQGEEIIPEYSMGINGDLDLNGKQFVFGMVKDYFFEGKDSVLTYIYNTEFGDLALQRLRDVEKKHNCTVVFRYVNRAGEAAYIDVISNSYTYDLVQEESYWLVSYIPTGIFTDLALLDNMSEIRKNGAIPRFFFPQCGTERFTE